MENILKQITKENMKKQSVELFALLDKTILYSINDYFFAMAGYNDILVYQIIRLSSTEYNVHYITKLNNDIGKWEEFPGVILEKIFRQCKEKIEKINIYKQD